MLSVPDVLQQFNGFLHRQSSDYKKMDAANLKCELHNIGIRALPMKKAVELLEHIWYRQHPEIRIQLDLDEPVVNASRMMFNEMDLLPNIQVHDDDEFCSCWNFPEKDLLLFIFLEGVG